jgi:hypothetical protein
VITDEMVLGAAHELKKFTAGEIHAAAAHQWGARALAAFEACRMVIRGLHPGLKTAGAEAWLVDAEGYAGEALEHAALSDDPNLVNAIRGQIVQARMTTLRG